MADPSKVLGFLDVAGKWDPSTATTIDRPLVIGSLVFGVGWGLAGFCPAPAVVAYGAGYFKGGRVRARHDRPHGHLRDRGAAEEQGRGRMRAGSLTVAASRRSEGT